MAAYLVVANQTLPGAELIDEDSLETLLEARPYARVIADEISGLEKEIEKIERAGLGPGEQLV